ncbi:MAG: hypothetical protein FK733_01770 [Asgard group archaeon]|nr:hypothetical protein [Asgard group archaeon]
MPYENCDNCRKCYPCPVTSSDKNEGAYPITQDTGDMWYCTSCFYCEDVCPENSPRQYAIDKRRKTGCSTDRMNQPLFQLKEHGSLFPISSDINELRSDRSLPIVPEIDKSEIKILYDSILNPSSVKTSSVNQRNKIICNKENESKIALFLGCLIPYRVHDYERTTREIMDTLSISYCDLPFSCCGSVMAESHSEDLWLVSAAYNLALAEENGIETIITICGGCAGNLRRVNQTLLSNNRLLAKVNSYLSNINKKYQGSIIVQHFSEFLLNEERLGKLATMLKDEQKISLQKLNASIQVPCQVIRPKSTSPNAKLESNLLKNLLRPIEINLVDYPFETLCCGSSILQYDVPLAHKIAKKRIDSLKKRKVDALILGCGNCSMNYTVHQNEYNDEILPTFFFTEIIAYALGYPNDDLSELLKT